MHKIPSLYLGDPVVPAIPCPVVQGGCYWVISGHGQATRKYDGLCVAYLPMRYSGDERSVWPLDPYPLHYQPGADPTQALNKGWFVRETYPLGVRSAPGFAQVDADASTVIGWRLADYTPLGELVNSATKAGQFQTGTYELVGPGVKGNPHEFDTLRLIKHSDAEVLADVPTRFDDLMHWLIDHADYAGVVWHHPDGRMAQMERAAALRWQEARGAVR